jgi:hypothetical protein
MVYFIKNGKKYLFFYWIFCDFLWAFKSLLIDIKKFIPIA